MTSLQDFEKKRVVWDQLTRDTRAFARGVMVFAVIAGFLVGAAAGSVVAGILLRDGGDARWVGAVIGSGIGGVLAATVAQFATLTLRLLAGILEALAEIEWNTTDDEPDTGPAAAPASSPDSAVPAPPTPLDR